MAEWTRLASPSLSPNPIVRSILLGWFLVCVAFRLSTMEVECRHCHNGPGVTVRLSRELSPRLVSPEIQPGVSDTHNYQNLLGSRPAVQPRKPDLKWASRSQTRYHPRTHSRTISYSTHSTTSMRTSTRFSQLSLVPRYAKGGGRPHCRTG